MSYAVRGTSPSRWRRSCSSPGRVFPFVWILLTSLKSPGDMISVPPKFVFTPTIDNYAALVIGEQRGQYSSTRPDFPLFFLNSMIISIGAVALSVAAGIPAAYALARFTFPLKDGARLRPHELPLRAVHRLRDPALPPLTSGSGCTTRMPG